MEIKKPKEVKYQGISLPLPLIQKVKAHIANDATYQTAPSFVRDAVREKISNKSQYIPRYTTNSTDALDMDKMIQKQNQMLDQQNQMLDQQNQMLDQLEKRNNELHQLLEGHMEIWKPPKTKTLDQDLSVKRGTSGSSG